MQDVKGLTLAVGLPVKYDRWDDSDKQNGPKRVPTTGTVSALGATDPNNELKGTLTVKNDDDGKKDEVDCQSVTIYAPDAAAKKK